MEMVRSIVSPYYEAAAEVALASPEDGRTYTDHKIGHAVMVGKRAWSAEELSGQPLHAAPWAARLRKAGQPLALGWTGWSWKLPA